MVLQEAASLKIMPSFDYTSVRPITINAETMPVFAAEVCYFLHLFLLHFFPVFVHQPCLHMSFIDFPSCKALASISEAAICNLQ